MRSVRRLAVVAGIVLCVSLPLLLLNTSHLRGARSNEPGGAALACPDPGILGRWFEYIVLSVPFEYRVTFPPQPLLCPADGDW
jgi:hypothetical protein